MKRLSALLFGIFFSSSIFAQPFLAPHKQDKPDMQISVATRDIDLLLEGRVREEFCYFDRISSLREDYHDTYHFFRNKMHLGSYVEYGRRQYGQAAIAAELQMCAYNYWDHPTQYAKLSEETIMLNKGLFRDEMAIGSEHTHFGEIPMFYQDEAWINIDFDVLTPRVPIPLSLKIGYFPYSVGRGVSMGDYHEGSISFMGWQDRTVESNATQSPQGILLISEFSESVQVELYYSKWRSYSTSPSSTREAVRASWLNVDPAGNDPKSVERGTKADRELVSGRVLLDGGTASGTTWHIQPYAVYVHAPEQRIELAADASTQMGTCGIMMEAKNEHFAINLEVAGQTGRQIMHSIDRNAQELDRNSTGDLSAVYSHILQSDGFTKQPVTDEINEVAYLFANRDANLPANHVLTKADGSALSGTFVTSSYPFLAKQRFRPEYRIDLRGYMAMLDAQYIAMNGRLRLSAAAAIISGDAYPYNDEQDKTYHGFLPLRDQNYDGKYVRSFAVLHARKFPRPLDMADNKLYAYNHDEDMANMRYIGVSAQWHPLKNPGEMVIMPSVLCFWQDYAPYKWDKEAVRTFGNSTNDTVYGICLEKLGFTGAASTERASNHLGVETSLAFIWNIAPSCELNVAASVFFPGQLYRDLDGMPNRNTRRVLPNGSLVHESLGSATMLGLNARLTFAF